MTSKPMKKIDFDPYIQSAIFENERQIELDDGSTLTRTVLSANVARRYFDKKDEAWKEAASYSLKELLVLREVVDQTIQALIESANNQVAKSDVEPMGEAA